MSPKSKRQPKVIVEIGAKHGSLTVIEHTQHTQPNGKKVRALKCQCDCGNETVVEIYNWEKQRTGCASCGKKRGWQSTSTTKFSDKTYLSVLRAGAKTRDIAFDINVHEYAELRSKPCHYCGGKASGVDRVDSSIGYVLHNVVPCCYSCNKAKSRMSVEEFADWVIKLHTHMLATNWEQQYVVPTQRLFGD